MRQSECAPQVHSPTSGHPSVLPALLLPASCTARRNEKDGSGVPQPSVSNTTNARAAAIIAQTPVAQDQSVHLRIALRKSRRGLLRWKVTKVRRGLLRWKAVAVEGVLVGPAAHHLQVTSCMPHSCANKATITLLLGRHQAHHVTNEVAVVISDKNHQIHHHFYYMYYF